ncbi:MAG: hypothetical protein H0V37_07550 [Chloroflexia bacterium]|nr:hypothetical protein [Chloroflexia bacterium]
MSIAGGEVLVRGGVPERLVGSDRFVILFPSLERLLEGFVSWKRCCRKVHDLDSQAAR